MNRVGSPAIISPDDPGYDARRATFNALIDRRAKLAPRATGAEYINYMAGDVPADRVRAAYGDAKYARLRDLKKRYDAGDVFRSNQNIAPANGAADD